MKARSFVAILILLLPSAVFSQQNSDKNKNSYWSLSYSYGVSGTLDMYQKYGSGQGKINSIEVSSIPEGNIGFFVSYASSEYHRTFYIKDVIINNNEYTAGAKFYFKDRKVFVSLGLGCYDNAYLKNTGGIGWTVFFEPQRKLSMGLNLGLGARVKLTDTYGLLISGKVHAMPLYEGNQSVYTYAGLNTGIEINNSQKLTLSKKIGRLSTGFLAGSVKSNNTSAIRMGAEITYSISDRFSLVGNYLQRRMNMENYFFSENNYSGGIRFYQGKNWLKFFIESLVDLNVQKKSIPWNFYDIMISKSLGITLGAGAEFALIEGFSGLIKVNMTKLDRPDSYKGFFGGVKYSF